MFDQGINFKVKGWVMGITLIALILLWVGVVTCSVKCIGAALFIGGTVICYAMADMKAFAARQKVQQQAKCRCCKDVLTCKDDDKRRCS